MKSDFLSAGPPPSRPMRRFARGPRAVAAAGSAIRGVHPRDLVTRRDDYLSPRLIAHLGDSCPSITSGTGVLPLANTTRRCRAQVAMSTPVERSTLLEWGQALRRRGGDRLPWAPTFNRKSQEALAKCAAAGEERRMHRRKFYRNHQGRSLNREIGVASQSAPATAAPPIALPFARRTPRGRTRQRPRRTGSRRPFWGVRVAPSKNYLKASLGGPFA